MTPKGWKHVNLSELTGGDAARFSDGDWIESKDQSPDGTIRLLQVGNVLPLKMKLSGAARWVTEDTAQRLGCTKLLAGDVLIARLPAPLGRAAILPELPYEAITAVDCAILRPDPDVAHLRYVLQVLNSDSYYDEVKSHATGSTRQRISRKNLGSISVPLPPLGEQRKIAAILGSVDEAIERTQAVIDQVQVVKQALMQQLLTRGLPGRHTRFKQTEIGEIPESWSLHRLQDVAYVQTGIAKNKKNEGDIAVPYLRVANVQDGYLELGEIKELRVSQRALERYHLVVGDVLFTEGGDADKLGRGTVWQGQLPKCLHQNHVFAVRVERKVLNPWFLSFWGSSKGGKSYFLNCAKQTTNLASINSTQLKALPVPIPPVAEQEQIVDLIRVLIARKDAETHNVEGLRNLKQSIMSVLLTGELRVTP